MVDKIVRALNLHGADWDLLNSDIDALIDVIDNYFSDDGTGNNSYTPIATPKIAMNVLLLILYLSLHSTMILN